MDQVLAYLGAEYVHRRELEDQMAKLTDLVEALKKGKANAEADSADDTVQPQG